MPPDGTDHGATNMLMIFKTQRAARITAIAAFALAVAGLGEAAAKSKGKKVVASLTPIGALAPSISARPPVRFFTINQVLAKYDSHSLSNVSDSIRFAALQPSRSISDVTHQSSTISPTTSDEPFGLYTFRAPEGLLWIKWRKAEADIAGESQTLQACRDNLDDCPSSAARRFMAVVEEVKSHKGRARIETVNRLINASIRYVSDLAQHGVADRWTAPLATFAAGRGDCEDYAIAKYVALREAGMAAADLRFLLVRDRLAGDHAVLSVRHEGRWLILDNRHLALADSSELAHFIPLFALDHQGVKLFAAPYADRGQLMGDTAPAARSDEPIPAPQVTAIAAQDAGLGAWSATPLLL